MGKEIFIVEVTWGHGHFSLNFQVFKEFLSVFKEGFKYFSIFKALRMERSMCGTQRVV